MIPALLISCALSLPSYFVGHHRNADAQIFKMLTEQLEVAHYDLHDPARQIHSPHRILVLHHRGGLVDDLRRSGLQAWLLSRFPTGEENSIQGSLKRSPIRRRSIQAVVVIQALSDINERCAVLAMIAPGGFLVADLMINTHLLNLMHERDWEYLPFKWHYSSIFRRAV